MTTDNSDIVDCLYGVIAGRKGADPSSSYVASLYDKGLLKIAEKLGEEAVETVIAAIGKDKAATVAESADLLFHLMVLWAELGITPDEVRAELARREGVSGIDEKNSRGS